MYITRLINCVGNAVMVEPSYGKKNVWSAKPKQHTVEPGLADTPRQLADNMDNSDSPYMHFNS